MLHKPYNIFDAIMPSLIALLICTSMQTSVLSTMCWHGELPYFFLERGHTKLDWQKIGTCISTCE